jgi:hypothetical protein
VANTTGESCFEAVEIRPHDIHVPIHYNTGQVLPYSLAHDSCFAEVYIETLLNQNGSDMRGKSLNMSSEILIAGKREIVCVARELRPNRSGQACQSAIGSIGAKVRKRRRSRGALR